MTLGWIYEGARDRFFDSTLEHYAPTSDFACPHCSTRTPTSKDLYDHLYAKHSVSRPFLLIHGREPHSTDQIRAPLTPSDALAFDVEKIEMSIDNGPMKEAKISNFVVAASKAGMRKIVVTLTNFAQSGGSNRKQYTFDVALPTLEEMLDTERRFVESFGCLHPHLNSIPNFMASTVGNASHGYAYALSEYVRGVLVKDRDPTSGAHGVSSEWPDAYKSALYILKDINRPLAVLICGIIRFALNDFSHWHESTEFAFLDYSARILGSISDGVDPKLEPVLLRPDRYIEVCPIDAGVSFVLDLAFRYSGLDRWGPIDDDNACAFSDQVQLGPYDRAKVRALWAWTALRLKSFKLADKPLSNLAGHDCFGPWAEKQLQGIRDEKR